MPVQGERRAVPHDVVAGPDEAAQLVAVLRADVEEEVVRLDRLAVLAPLALLPSRGDDAGNGAVAGEDVDALAGHHGRVPAARLAHRGEPVVAEIRDDDGDLVDVADERERRPSGCAGHAHPRVAEDVGRDLADGRGGLPPHGGGGAFLARRDRASSAGVRADSGSGHGRERHYRRLSCHSALASRREAPDVARQLRRRPASARLRPAGVGRQGPVPLGHANRSRGLGRLPRPRRARGRERRPRLDRARGDGAARLLAHGSHRLARRSRSRRPSCRSS